MKITIQKVSNSEIFFVETEKWDKAKRQKIEVSYSVENISELHKLINKIYN